MLKVLDNQPAPTATPGPSLYNRTARAATYGDGFYEVDRDDFETFHWMGERATLAVNGQPEPAYLEIKVFSEFFDLSQELTIRSGESTETRRLVHGWRTLSVPIVPGTARVDLELNKLFPPSCYPEDHRSLGVRIGPAIVHLDSERHRAVDRLQHNAERNTEEMLAGRTILGSTPTSLGIDMYGVCNVKPPCVYCDWDYAKDLEEDNVEAPFNLETLDEYGEFFDNSSSLINCSIGEPFMMKGFDGLLDAFGDSGKKVEITTNGQILTDKNIEKLVGREIELYISLDAATPETYAQLRNDTFERILGNLRRLVAAKGGRAGLPRIYLVFMPMKVNVDELDDFVRLCADLEVDRLVLRPLNYLEESELNWDRAGYSFVYDDELLDFEELIKVSGRARELCDQLGVPLSDQLDFGGEMEGLFEEGFQAGRDEVNGADEPSPPSEVEAGSSGTHGTHAPQPAESTSDPSNGSPGTGQESLGSESLPACLEPWKSFYILRRGVMPCCYGHGPIAEMGEYRKTWNAPIMQDIRGELAAGRFHKFCVDSTACPIVRKADHLTEPPLRYPRFNALRYWSLVVDGKRALKAIDRALFGELGTRTFRRFRDRNDPTPPAA